MGAADCVDRQPGACRARQGRQDARAAAMMIEVELFTYSDEQWDQIRIVVRDALGLDADQIKREVARLRIGDEESITEMQSLRDRIAAAAGENPLHRSPQPQRLPPPPPLPPPTPHPPTT